MATMNNEKAREFKNRFAGKVILPGDAEYDDERAIWNGMIDRKPAVIAQCKTAGDVVQAVHFGRDEDLLVSVRGGGHNIAGKAVCDDGLMIDLSPMKKVTVDTEARVATVEPGCTLADLDEATLPHGLATPTGINSTTGVAGLTLGGGFGWLSRKLGMTIDNLLSATVVTAAGEQVVASESENPDLFWGLRGGGGNFGIVTEFTFKLHPVGPDLLSGLIVFPFDEAKQVLLKFAEFTQEMPDELNVWFVTRKAPPLPFLPEEVHGKEVAVLAVCYAGDPAEGEKLVEPLRGFGTVVGEHVGAQPFVDWQKAFDPLLTPGARNYWKSHNFTEISEGVIDAIIEYAAKLPSPHCEIFIGTIGGQTARVDGGAMAYSCRDANYVMNVHGRWEAPAEDQAVIGWAREFFNKSKPYASGGAYINFLTEEEMDRLEFAYGATFQKLKDLKKKYDPDNFFRMNQNIKPG